jgi:uncharacterized protein (UPF0276 family)
MDFANRVEKLPVLGIGISTEYGAFDTPNALCPETLARAHPEFAGFLEVGIEVSKGLDRAAQRWMASQRPVTYHFLDVNLDEEADFDPQWLDSMGEFIHQMEPAWLCGDAGLWHFGPRDRNHMILLPPVLCSDAARDQAAGVQRLREATGLEVLPENPPGHLFLGDLHILEFFSQVMDHADTGMLLDCAHLAIYQRAMGHAPTTGLDAFPLERVVEIHVAGATTGLVGDYRYVEDDHTVDVLPDTWEIFSYVLEHASNLKAVVFECERNPLARTLPGFQRIKAMVDAHGRLRDAV